MASNPYAGKDRELDRKLRRLSNKYEKDTAHYREYADAVMDIRQLRHAGKLDRADARDLERKAKAVFDAAEEQHKLRRRDERQQREFDHTYPKVVIVLVLFVVAIVLAVTFS